MPHIQDRLNDAPASFHHVGTLEKGGVTNHAVAQQPLVSGGMFRPEVSGVIEIHVYKAKLHYGPRNFGAEAKRDALVRLDVNDQTICFKITHAGVAKEDKGGAPELDHDFSYTARKALAGPQIKRNAGPTPIIDLQFQGHECFGVRIARHVRLAAIADDALAIDGALAILTANHAGKNFFGTEWLDRVKNFGLFVANFVGVEGNGRLHGCHGEQLK